MTVSKEQNHGSLWSVGVLEQAITIFDLFIRMDNIRTAKSTLTRVLRRVGSSEGKGGMDGTAVFQSGR